MGCAYERLRRPLGAREWAPSGRVVVRGVPKVWPHPPSALLPSSFPLSAVAATQKGVQEWAAQGLLFAATRAPEHALQPEVLDLDTM